MQKTINNGYISKKPPPPYGLRYNETQKLKINFIEVNEYDLNGDKTKKASNYWYSKFEYFRKKYYQTTSKSKNLI